jgi:hypothetical protein
MMIYQPTCHTASPPYHKTHPYTQTNILGVSVEEAELAAAAMVVSEPAAVEQAVAATAA